jgi:hypothetical protein
MASGKWSAPDPSEVGLFPTINKARKDMRTFLRRFGHLDRSRDIDSYSIEEEQAALQTFQRICGIDETGEYDDATQKMMNKKRCGYTGTNGPSEFVLSRCKWNKSVITWRLQGGSEDLPVDRVKNALRRAFSEWDRYMRHHSLREVSTEADIVIIFARGAHGDGNDFDGAGRVLAHAYFPPPCGGMLAGDIHFDEDERWTDDFLMQVALHEVGHSLGLQHSTDRNAVMFPIFTAGKSTLRTDDIAGIKTIYP